MMGKRKPLTLGRSIYGLMGHRAGGAPLSCELYRVSPSPGTRVNHVDREEFLKGCEEKKRGNAGNSRFDDWSAVWQEVLGSWSKVPSSPRCSLAKAFVLQAATCRATIGKVFAV
jgi:hypothetical protein